MLTAVNLDSLNPAYVGKLGAGRVNPLAAVQSLGGRCCFGSTGNVDGQGTIDLSDLSLLIAYLTFSGMTLPCVDEANLDGHGSVDLTDLAIMISYIVTGTRNFAPCP